MMDDMMGNMMPAMKEGKGKKKKMMDKADHGMGMDMMPMMKEGKDHDGDGDIDSDDYMAAKDAAIKKAMKEDESADSAEKMKGEDPCWKDYEMVGMKKKNGKEVPNCVPKGSAGECGKSSYSEVNVPDGWSVSDRVYKN